MFCNQCEQTAGGVACVKSGACGKSAEVSALQDLIMHEVVALSLWAAEGRRLGLVRPEIDGFVDKAVFHTVTNVDFDPASLAEVIYDGYSHLQCLRADVLAAGGVVASVDPALAFVPAEDVDALVAQGERVGHFSDRASDEDVRSLMQITIYGVKGVCAYADHARVLGQTDPAVEGYVYEAFAALTDPSLGVSEWVTLALGAGETNLRAMELLDAGNTGRFGHPVPTAVPLGHRANKAILVSGHDLEDLAGLLEQTEGKGIDVYTHGEMLPAHGYPGLKRHAHLYGHFGTAWQNQRRELAEFPGPVLFTTNCIQNPLESYADNVFTTGNVAFPGTTHVAGGDFAAVIERALELPGFTDTADAGEVTVGFGREAVLSVAPAVVDAVKSGAIRHFLLVGGCDGARPGRSYYSDLVDGAPADTVILTLACGKFRFFDHDLGEIAGIPRLLDVGQCNDAYSAVRIALALAEAFGVGVNDLPLSLVLSWYEQKAVAVLLTLLHLGIKGIRLGPSLPAFVTPNVLSVLAEGFGVRPVGESAAADLAEMLGEPSGEVA